MSVDLLAQVQVQVKGSESPVREAALMRIARVQTAFDRGQARITFEMALGEVRRLSGRDREALLEQARLVAAAVAPDLLPELPFAGRMPRQFASDMIIRIMLDHGQVDAALEYVLESADPSMFPFRWAANLMQRLDDQASRVAVMQRAADAWRVTQDDGFVWLFRSHWKVLPAGEARELTREIVNLALEQADTEISARYDEGLIQITSQREHTFFQILHILRHLDGALADSLISEYSQLAVAAQRFPNGMETMMQEAEDCRKKAPGEACNGGFAMAGNSRDFPYLTALIQASQNGDFTKLIEYALERYSEDIEPDGPNQAPKEFWPSTCNFRNILYRAGKRLGRDAVVYLDRISDKDIRMFAQIELVAALANLPELQGTQQRRHRPLPGGTQRA